jgi:hypothetical protein
MQPHVFLPVCVGGGGRELLSLPSGLVLDKDVEPVAASSFLETLYMAGTCKGEGWVTHSVAGVHVRRGSQGSGETSRTRRGARGSKEAEGGGETHCGCGCTMG